MKYLVLTLAHLIACEAWAPVTPKLPSAQLFLSSSMETGLPDEMFPDEDPCWQNIYDDDCAMSKANLAFFRASAWIKSMPCAEGIEVR